MPGHPDDLLQHDCIVMRFALGIDRTSVSVTRTALHIVYPPSKIQPRRVKTLIDAIANDLAPGGS